MSTDILSISKLRSLFVRLLILCVLGISMTACSTVSKVKTKAVATLEKVSETTNIGNNPDDPLEGFNRSMFSFNESLDANVLKPTAQAYQKVTPSIVQTANPKIYRFLFHHLPLTKIHLQTKAANATVKIRILKILLKHPSRQQEIQPQHQ